MGCQSTYIKLPPYFENMPKNPPARLPTFMARASWRFLATASRPITSLPQAPSPSIHPPENILIAHGVKPHEFNSYGARRGNHEVMMRGTFANIRLRNQLAPGTEGGWTLHLPDGEKMYIYEPP